MKKKMLPFLLMLFILITSCRLTPHPVPTMTPSATVEVTLTPTIAIMPSRFPSETPTLEATVERTESAEGELARRHVVYLSEEIGQRIAGTESELQAAQYIQSVLNNLGYEVLVQPFPFGGIEVSATPDPSSLAQGSQNVIAINTIILSKQKEVCFAKLRSYPIIQTRLKLSRNYGNAAT